MKSEGESNHGRGVSHREGTALRREAEERGLYRAAFEHDACGVGFVANIKGQAHRTTSSSKGLTVLQNLTHRGACGCDPLTGDGAGILVQVAGRVPSQRVRQARASSCPPPGDYGVGMVFLPRDVAPAQRLRARLREDRPRGGPEAPRLAHVPVDEAPGGSARAHIVPEIRQVFVGARHGDAPIRRRSSASSTSSASASSSWSASSEPERPRESSTCRACRRARSSTRACLLPEQIPASTTTSPIPASPARWPSCTSASRTNTFPSWDRAHPYRFIAHNGEINTLRGNIELDARAPERCSRRRSSATMTEALPDHATRRQRLGQRSTTRSSCSIRTGRSLPHAVMMMIPEAWQNHEAMSDDEARFYEYHACLMEPWDGPASIAFTDGRVIGAVLDRNGLRPSRYVVTKDGFVVMASEVGVLDIAPENVVAQGPPAARAHVPRRHGAGAASSATRRSRRRWRRGSPTASGSTLNLDAARASCRPPIDVPPACSPDTLLTRQQAFGYTLEDLRILMTPMAINGQEAVGSMGTDTPLAVLSGHARSSSSPTSSSSSRR